MSFKKNLFNYATLNANSPAVTSHDETWDYGFLLEHSENIRLAVKPFNRVGLFFEKSKEYILSLFAVTLSETAFIPLELISPKERLEYIIHDSGIDTIITSIKYEEVDLKKIPKHINVLYIEDLMLSPSKPTQPNPEKANEPAYVIYTSGSTGTPKGVEVSFNGLSNVIEQQIKILDINKNKFYLYLSISFDASLSDIYCSLLSSSELCIFDCLKHNAIGLLQYFNAAEITHSDLPPALLKLLNPSDFTTLKAIIIGGEVADYNTIQRFTESIKVINVYGPTEATICTSMIVCDNTWSKPLIGKPLNNVGYKIINQNNQEITPNNINVKGELIITGCQLANGYLNNINMNNEKFVTLFGELSYKTGDLVSYNEDGLIEFKGRADRQIKYNGQLICLEEIEGAINSIQDISSVTVLFKNKKIYAYYEGMITEVEIRDFLKTKIPSYMIPSFIINKNIPKTVTGKNDGKLLKVQNSFNDEANAIKNIFTTILNDQNLVISINDSFIQDLGADSINFIELHLALQNIGLYIPYNYLIENNSIKDILNFNNELLKIDTDFLVQEYSKMPIPHLTQVLDKQDKNIALITGSTGLLGSSLLPKLTQEFNTVYCLVRCVNVEEAYLRLTLSLKKHNVLINDEDLSRIKIILGDTSAINLGLSTDIYQELSINVDHVYHCAANVNNILSFQQLYEANVLSTINIADFVFLGRNKELHYASTLSVFVSSDQLNNSTFNEAPITNDGHTLYSGYAQTKWLSEYYLTQLNNISNNIYIYRFGLITPSTTEDTPQVSGFLLNCIEGFKNIDSIPDTKIPLSMDITPLDIAANAMFDISISQSTSRIFNITANQKLTLNLIAEKLNIGTFVEAKKWMEVNENHLVTQHLTELNLEHKKQHNMNLFETTHIKHFHNTNAFNYIKDFNFNLYLDRIIT